MSKYYSIDDQHGNNICSGIQLEHKARECAQRYANSLGSPVLLYNNEGEEELVEPEPSETEDYEPDSADSREDSGDLLNADSASAIGGRVGLHAMKNLDRAFELIESWRHRANICDRIAETIEHGEGSAASISRISAKAGVFRACATELERALNER